MIPALRQRYNETFTEEHYASFINALENLYPGQLDFRVAETPIFVPASFRDAMLSACEAIIDRVLQPAYREQSARALPPQLQVPGEDAHPHCIAFDFGICRGAGGALEPQLIEMQGFPSLFAWQVLLAETHARRLWQPPQGTPYLNGLDRESYIALLRNMIIGDEDPQSVILLEVLPHQQKTRVDFYATKSLIGIETVCLTELRQEGRRLYYERDGRSITIKRIYNRVIFDDLDQQPEAVRRCGHIFSEALDVTWVPHPNWFYRLSKFTLPFIDHPNVPPTRFLNALHTMPDDLHNYVAKPLFSFAGQGVIIDVGPEDIAAIPDPQNWILQRKVEYADAIMTPDGGAKGEIRLFYFWEKGKERPVAANNLARLSKGKMVGVRYNKDKTWVGGSFCLFEP